MADAYVETQNLASLHMQTHPDGTVLTMKIEKLVIENFKSIERIELIQPNPFTVFVGPNGSGKSNIFEALEFVNYISRYDRHTGLRLFGGSENILNRITKNDLFHFSGNFNGQSPEFANIDFKLSEVGSSYNYLSVLSKNYKYAEYLHESGDWHDEYEQFYKFFSHIFVRNIKMIKYDFQDNESLNGAATNLEKVLKRILTDSTLKAEIFEWLELFIPGFKAVEVDDRNELHWFEDAHDQYFTKDLISDGTYNILAMLAAVYQSDDQPQFLCIEEPENGLHPQVLMTLVDFFRQQCEEKGHYIWLNTHSESIVRKLTTDEIVLVNKYNGATEVRQIKGRNIYDLPTEEAWLTGALGGGLPW
jgi:predicted ATPase